MEVILADVLGYCMGVRRAVLAAEKALEDNPDKKVYSLGPLIHNASVLKSLSEKGLCILEEGNIQNVQEESVVVIRAHGVSPQVQEKLSEKKCKIIDATCPRVVGSQRNVRDYSRKGWAVFLAGDKNHGEVLGIQGFAQGDFYLIQNESEAEEICLSLPEKNAVLLSQTTFSPLEFEKIANVLRNKYKNLLKVMNTICPATRERQEALVKLCQQVHAIVVVGGKNSANTKRLLQTAQKYCKNCILIEKAEEIPDSFSGFGKVGVTAGASTPDEDIEEVCKKLKSL